MGGTAAVTMVRSDESGLEADAYRAARCVVRATCITNEPAAAAAAA